MELLGIKVWIYKGEIFAKNLAKERNKRKVSNKCLQPTRTKYRKAHKGRIHGKCFKM